jgi:hypothetical protein
MASDEFIPLCPACGYDLRGTPVDRCPECGKLFDRATVFNPPPDAPKDPPLPDLPLVLAVFFGFIGYSFSDPHAQLKQLAYVAMLWILTVVWVIRRRRSILGERPSLALWVVLVAVLAGNRANIEPHVQPWIYALSGLVATAVIGFALARQPRTAVRMLLYTAAVVVGFLGSILLIIAPLAWIGVLDGTGYQVYGATLPAAAANHAIALAIGIMHLIAAWIAYRLGRSLDG